MASFFGVFLTCKEAAKGDFFVEIRPTPSPETHLPDSRFFADSYLFRITAKNPYPKNITKSLK